MKDKNLSDSPPLLLRRRPNINAVQQHCWLLSIEKFV